ncbi:MAG: acetolactate synthase small subunit [Gammaproteobacteria bacterium]|nr:acetolactate synthase small subunit [Gammaproteobacteria bacterium]|tara:strand:- start:194 stop:688 length:495 start_codon:yes stop_codon:yes gene_type:complete
MKHTIAILLQNESGALTRVASMFSTRGYNIDSLSVAPTDNSSISRLTLVTQGSDEVIGQITKQLYKLIDVVDVLDISQHDHIERELMMIKLKINDDKEGDIKTVLYDYSATIVNDKDQLLIIEVMADTAKNDKLLEALSAMSTLVAVARTGPLALAKGDLKINL